MSRPDAPLSPEARPASGVRLIVSCDGGDGDLARQADVLLRLIARGAAANLPPESDPGKLEAAAA